MHIAHFTNTYHPVISGVVRSISSFRKALVELGHNVFIVAQDSPGYVDEEPFVFRYPTIKLKFPSEFPAAIPISPFIDYLLPRLKPEVIHTHHPFLVGQAAANKASELKLPLVFTFHTRYREYSHYVPLSQDVVQEFVKERIEHWLADFVKKCDHVIVPTESMRRVVVEEYGISGNLTVIPTGIETRPYTEADGEIVRQKHEWGDGRVLISVGRLAKEKNWLTLLEAIAKVIAKHEDVRLVLIGDGPQRKDLGKTARELGIADKVEFTGELAFEEVPGYLRAADLFVFASITETQGLVTMEAMAAGLPVVAVDGSGTSDVVDHGRQGLLTENDSQALAAAIETVLADGSTISSFSQAALEKAKTFDSIYQAKRLVEVYQQVIEEHGAPVPA